jgi:Tol biopolymer transport system component
MTLLLILVTVTSAFAQTGGRIAFIRNNEVWTMNADGSNQKALVAGIQNAKGKLSWEPGNKRIAFARNGSVAVKYPDGGGGQHATYDLFFAFVDSTNNFWMGFTETLGAQNPDWSADGSKIAFTYDVTSNTANSTWPRYRIGFYDVKSRVVSELDMPKSDNPLFAMGPSLSPDGTRLAFVLAEFTGKQLVPKGIVVTSSTKITQTAEQLLAEAKMLSGGTAPSWSPDGNWIAYISNDMKNPGILAVRPDYTGKKELYIPAAGIAIQGSAPSWSPDSRRLAFGTANGSIYTVNADGTGAAQISGPGSDAFPAWSK